MIGIPIKITACYLDTVKYRLTLMEPQMTITQQNDEKFIEESKKQQVDDFTNTHRNRSRQSSISGATTAATIHLHQQALRMSF